MRLRTALTLPSQLVYHRYADETLPKVYAIQHSQRAAPSELPSDAATAMLNDRYGRFESFAGGCDALASVVRDGQIPSISDD